MKVTKAIKRRVYRKVIGEPNGHKCKEYTPKCVICEAFGYYDEHGVWRINPIYKQTHEQSTPE